MTEKKTAEELASRLRCTNGLMCEHHTDHAKRLFEQYAAQELADYKARLKKRIRDWNSTSIEEVPPSYSWKDIFELIDNI